MKTCTKCGETKPKSEFAKDLTLKDKCKSICKICDNKRKKEYYSNNKELCKERVRKSQFKFIYGITLEDYEYQYKNQKGCCYICGKNEEQTGIRLAVDHCHKTNKVRKLLCRNCNLLLGHAKDDSEILKKAISYLEEHNEY